MVEAVEKGMREAPEPGAPAPATGHSPTHPLFDCFCHRFLAFCGSFLLPCVGSGGRRFLGTRLVWETDWSILGGILVDRHIRFSLRSLRELQPKDALIFFLCICVYLRICVFVYVCVLCVCVGLM